MLEQNDATSYKLSIKLLLTSWFHNLDKKISGSLQNYLRIVINWWAIFLKLFLVPYRCLFYLFSTLIFGREQFHEIGGFTNKSFEKKVLKTWSSRGHGVQTLVLNMSQVPEKPGSFTSRHEAQWYLFIRPSLAVWCTSPSNSPPPVCYEGIEFLSQTGQPQSHIFYKYFQWLTTGRLKLMSENLVQCPKYKVKFA